MLRRSKSTKPEITLVKKENLLAEEKILAWIDLKSSTIDDLNVIGGQELVYPAQKSAKMAGVCVWFNVEFPDGSILSTAPYEEPTHWKQTVIMLSHLADVDEGEPLAFCLTLTRDNDNKRWYNLEMKILDPETTEHDLPCDCHMTKCIVAKEYIKEHSQVI